MTVWSILVLAALAATIAIAEPIPGEPQSRPLITPAPQLPQHVFLTDSTSRNVLGKRQICAISCLGNACCDYGQVCDYRQINKVRCRNLSNELSSLLDFNSLSFSNDLASISSVFMNALTSTYDLDLLMSSFSALIPQSLIDNLSLDYLTSSTPANYGFFTSQPYNATPTRAPLIGGSQSTSSSITANSDPGGGTSSHTGAIVGGVLGGMAAIGALITFILYLRYRKRKRAREAAAAPASASQVPQHYEPEKLSAPPPPPMPSAAEMGNDTMKPAPPQPPPAPVQQPQWTGSTVGGNIPPQQWTGATTHSPPPPPHVAEMPVSAQQQWTGPPGPTEMNGQSAWVPPPPQGPPPGGEYHELDPQMHRR